MLTLADQVKQSTVLVVLAVPIEVLGHRLLSV